MLAVKLRRLLCLLLRCGSLFFVRCGFGDVVCSHAVHANGRKDNKCYDLGGKKGSVFVKFVAVVRPRFAASMWIFIWDFFFSFDKGTHAVVTHACSHPYTQITLCFPCTLI